MFRKLFHQVKSLIILILFSSTCFFSQSDNLKLNEWITNWYLLGPIQLEESFNEVDHLVGFETEVLASHGGESNFNIDIGKVVTFNNSSSAWTKYSSPDSTINLDKAISNKSYIAAYAYKEILTEDEGTYIFSIGTNDGGRLWINGQEVWDYPGARGLKPDDNLIPILLKKGKNDILLKVEERGNSWGFCARILPFNIDTFAKMGNIFNVVTLPNGNSELRFSLSDRVIDNLFKSVKLAIYSDNRSSDLIWSGDWPKKNRMKLEINNQEYKPYKLKIIAERRDNVEWKNEIKFNSGKRINYSLFSENKTKYRIIIGEQASESEKWAVEELQKTLNNISGASFQIDSDNSVLTENEIIVGYNKHSKIILGSSFSEPALLDESFIYKNIKSNIVLVGGKQRGTMYAVFSFLENLFGVRWYTPDVIVTPKKDSYSFNYIDHFESPSIQVRNDFYYEAFNPTWAAYNKINGAMGFRKQPGDIEGYWSVHTFYKFMPPSEFYDTHPEYYSLIDGKRIHERSQLCLTNPNVLDIITERLKIAMKENPSNLIYSVSQNDWGNPCQCDNCQAIVDDEGNQSGIMVWFVNQVADRVKNEFPNKYVGTLAYQYTRNPPLKIKPKENVVIRLCSIECCFAHDFYTCPENQVFLSDLEKWSAISPHLYIWDYVVNFSHYIMPYPNFNVLQSNLKTFMDNSSIGIMEQAAYQSRGGEFAELRAYVIAKLLWDVNSNVDQLINDFMYGYYGRSGQYVRKYFDLLHDQVKPNTHIHLGLRPDDILFTDEFINDADHFFDKAEIAAENDDIKKRVEMARLPLMYLKCKRDPVNSKYDGTYERFTNIVEREGITHFAEAGKPHVEDFHQQVINAE